MQEVLVMISVIMPMFNAATRHKFLNDSINSFLEQTYQDKELIIVNDESTDNSYTHILDTFGKYDRKNEGGYIADNIRIYRRVHRGQAASQNFGVTAANGEFITLLDDDDMFYDKHSLEKRMSEFDDNIDVVITAYIEQHGDNGTQTQLDNNIDNLKNLIWSKPGIFALQGCTWRKSLHKTLEKDGIEWGEDLSSAEDVDMKLQLLYECKCKAVNIPTYRHRYHPNMRSDKHRRSGELDKNKSALYAHRKEKYKGE
jgi:glycosyltransferase involved in cell wall biosynthesis